MKSFLLATVALALAALLVSWLLRRFKVESPLLHRLAWASVLAQGLFLAGIPIELPLLEPAPAVVEIANPNSAATTGNALVESNAPVSASETMGKAESSKGATSSPLGKG